MIMSKRAELKLEREINALLQVYDSNQKMVENFLILLSASLENSTELIPHVHSIRKRLKDREHLRGKLIRKMEKCKVQKEQFAITPDNLLTEVNDLAGIRILHLHTRQIQEIDIALRKIFDEYKYVLAEPPSARTWDIEYRKFFSDSGFELKDSGFEPKENQTMYTSVHYIVGSNTKTPMTCEIQVRTLMEEVWGEVDHLINYPVPTPILTSSEQIKVLARVTSSATRLVDSIFLTHAAAVKDTL